MTGRSIEWYSFACFPFFYNVDMFFLSCFAVDELSFIKLDGGFLGEALFYYFQTFFSSGSYYYYFLTGFGLTAILGLAITFNIGFKNIFKLFQILKIFIFFIFKMISKGKLRLIF